MWHWPGMNRWRGWLRGCLVLLLLGGSPAGAGGEDPYPEFVADYDVRVNGIKVGSATFRLSHLERDEYLYRSEASKAGLGRLLGSDKATIMLISEKVAAGGSFAVTHGAQSGIGTLPIVYFGTAEPRGDDPRLVKLFGVEGMGVLRTEAQDDGSYRLFNRECAFYKDPFTGQFIDTWTNPFTQEEVKVVSIHNMTVNAEVAPVFKMDFDGKVQEIPFAPPWWIQEKIDTAMNTMAHTGYQGSHAKATNAHSTAMITPTVRAHTAPVNR